MGTRRMEPFCQFAVAAAKGRPSEDGGLDTTRRWTPSGWLRSRSGTAALLAMEGSNTVGGEATVESCSGAADDL